MHLRFFISFICLLSYSTLLGQIGPGSLDCSQWLSLPTYPSFVDIGDLDISGNQITIEALINRTGPYNPGVGDGNEGDIVSKHWDPTNVNYLLRLNHVFITTENGFFQTGDPCPIELNKTYHVALVYDGVTLKYFRDGFLLSSTPATGNLIQSDLPARIGLYSGTIVENLIGYINEVRIWNVARTQEQIRTFMSGSLPSPTTQPGLLAYYHFNNLLNKQGNTAWNGSLGGFATINSSNPDCENNPDSCGQSFSPYIINDYTPVTGLDVCNNRITVEDATAFNPGDTVLIIQMQGALADTSNSTLFGDVTANHNAGHHEFNIINSINGNSIYLLNSILRSYDVPEGKVQLVRVPYFTNFEVSAPLSCPEWNGKTGGVLVLTVKDTLTLNADIDVSAKGFRGGLDPAINSPTPNCNENDFSFPANSPLASGKGEGYALLSANHASGKGRIANGGGGGNSYKSGGGGGGNGGRGGLGGYQFEAAPCNSTIPFANGGLDGRESINSNFETRIGLGGGGGAGHSNNQTGFKADGGAGGGLAIIKCDVLKNNGHSIISNGENAPECGNNTPGCLVGSGGGGAGGTLVLVSNTIQNPLPVSLNGGKGADLWAGGAGKAGPGGGGGGGSIMVSNSSLPPAVILSTTGGANGVCRNFANEAWGATSGSIGNAGFNWIVPFAGTPFVKNIDSIAISLVSSNCNSFQWDAIGFTQYNPITSWTWDFGDQTTGNSASESHIYNPEGTYQITLFGEDQTGCRDTATTQIVATTIQVDAGPDSTICSNGPAQIMLHANTNAGAFSWSPAVYLANSNTLTPTASIATTTTFYLQASTGSCSGIDSVRIMIASLPFVQTIPDTAICLGSTLLLSSSTNAGQVFWNPGAPVSDPQILSPQFNGNASAQLIITAESPAGCFSFDTLHITVNPLPDVQTIADTSFCGQASFSLATTGAINYTWTPPANLSNPNIASPQFTGTYPFNQVLHVQGTDSNGCVGTDSVQIRINPVPIVATLPDTTVCDGTVLHLSSFSDANQFSWLPSNAVSSPNILSPVFVSHHAETLSLIGTISSTGCADTATVNIQIAPTPQVQTINNFTSCTNGPFNLTTTGALSYQWQPVSNLDNPHIASPVFTSPSTGTYTFYVTGYSAEGCEGKDSVTISTGEKPVFNAPAQPQPQCAGSPVQLNAFNGNNYTYTWSPAVAINNVHIYNPVVSPLSQTTYSLTIHDAFCLYDSTFSIIVNVLPKPNLQVSKSNDIDCQHAFASLNSIGSSTYSWFPTAGLSDANIPNPIATPLQTTSYIVTGYNASGCIARDTVTVFVKGGQYFQFNIPNSFTPNGDNLNDCFGVRYWGQAGKFHLIIFNRYGETVFETRSKDQCWDGHYLGKPALAGNYVYHLTADTPCGKVDKKGNVLLIR